MMKKRTGVITLAVVLLIFSVGYFVIANKISYNFDVDYEEDLYNMKIESIEKQAAIYGKNNKELFTEGNSIYMTVEELALANVILSSKEGVVNDPRNDNKTLNELKVKITNEENKVIAKVLV